MIRSIKDFFQRKNTKRGNRDQDSIQNTIYNEATGSQKNINLEPVIKDTYTANQQVEFGALVKVAADGTYDQICVGKDHSDSEDYRLGQIVTSGGDVYICTVPHKAEAFDASADTGKWTKVAPATISGIPVKAGQTVCVGKYHNSISVAGFLVDDSSVFSKVE